MSSDNFHFHAKSGKLYLNLSASRYWSVKPLTEKRIIADGYKPTNLSIDDIIDNDDKFYSEYGIWCEEE